MHDETFRIKLRCNILRRFQIKFNKMERSRHFHKLSKLWNENELFIPFIPGPGAINPYHTPLRQPTLL